MQRKSHKKYIAGRGQSECSQFTGPLHGFSNGLLFSVAGSGCVSVKQKLVLRLDGGTLFIRMFF